MDKAWAWAALGLAVWWWVRQSEPEEMPVVYSSGRGLLGPVSGAGAGGGHVPGAGAEAAGPVGVSVGTVPDGWPVNVVRDMTVRIRGGGVAPSWSAMAAQWQGGA